MIRYLFLLVCFVNVAFAQVIGLDIDVSSPDPGFKSGKEVIDHMYQKFKNGPCKHYTFSQTNTHYKNDTVSGHSEWFEYIEFPDKFRINFGDYKNGNFVVFRNDSSLRFKNFVLVRASVDKNSLLLLLGGMYYRSQDDVLSRLKEAGYNTELLSSQKWNKQAVYVIGANEGDLTTNQIWVSKKNLRIVRIIEKWEDGSVMDMTFDDYQKHCNGYVETKVTFKRNGKTEQVEEYHNITETTGFSADTFYPKSK